MRGRKSQRCLDRRTAASLNVHYRKDTKLKGIEVTWIVSGDWEWSRTRPVRATKELGSGQQM